MMNHEEKAQFTEYGESPVVKGHSQESAEWKNLTLSFRSLTGPYREARSITPLVRFLIHIVSGLPAITFLTMFR
ncbi:hypothetical protein CHU32_22470 [Superficieibacter electus]|uniref:Uncharacterized protein n=1 Tax=Superficieibacter electus TaxID=2022662 RepID=A0A2P5GJI3_9ENTR|nr:hypothetical protein CHU33_22930 [Superficieibacter electus]POP43970.1 hypothetical protein CHU32_22470 [Superficieibacter electus]